VLFKKKNTTDTQTNPCTPLPNYLYIKKTSSLACKMLGSVFSAAKRHAMVARAPYYQVVPQVSNSGSTSTGDSWLLK